MAVAMEATVLYLVWWKGTCSLNLQDTEISSLQIYLPTMSAILYAIHLHHHLFTVFFLTNYLNHQFTTTEVNIFLCLNQSTDIKNQTHVRIFYVIL